MKKRRSKIAAWILMLAIVTVSAFFGRQSTKVQAASCSIQLSMEEEYVIRGDEFIVTLSIVAGEEVSGIEMLLYYDEDAMEFVEASPGITGEEGTLLLLSSDISDPQTTTTYLIKFKAVKTGTSYIKVGDDPVVYNESSGSTMSCASNVLGVEVTSTTKLSDNTDLESLKIATGTLNPEFSNKTDEYTVTVPADTERFIVTATPEDSNATISVSGNQKLVTGENIVKVITTAENGETKEITITVNKEEGSEDQDEEITAEETNEEDSEEVMSIDSEEDSDSDQQPYLSVEKVDDQIVITTWGSFTILECPDETEVPEGYEATTMLIDGTKVPVYKSEEDTDFVLIYASMEGADAGFYQIDTKTLTISSLHVIQSDSEKVQELTKEYQAKLSGYQKQIRFLAAAVLMLFAACAAMGYIFIRRHRRKKQDKRY